MGSVSRLLVDYGPAFGQALLLTWKLTALSFAAGFALGLQVGEGGLHDGLDAGALVGAGVDRVQHAVHAAPMTHGAVAAHHHVATRAAGAHAWPALHHARTMRCHGWHGRERNSAGPGLSSRTASISNSTGIAAASSAPPPSSRSRARRPTPGPDTARCAGLIQVKVLHARSPLAADPAGAARTARREWPRLSGAWRELPRPYPARPG